MLYNPANDPLPTADAVEQLFAATAREITPERATDVVQFLRTWGSYADQAVGGNFGKLSQAEHDFLQYRQAQQEDGRPELIAARLRQSAADLDYRADQVLKDAAEYAGMAAGKRRNGDELGAERLQRQQLACDEQYAALDEQSFKLKMLACQFEVRVVLNDAFSELTSFSTSGAA